MLLYKINILLLFLLINININKITKLNLLSILFICTIFAGCTKDSELSTDTSSEFTNENGIPIFADLDSFFAYSVKVYSMTINERTLYEDSLNFTSLQTAYELASEESEELESYDDYLLWKDKNIDNWKFSIIDDAEEFTYPIQRMCDAYATDTKGRVIINNQLHDLTNADDNFYKLISTSDNYLKSTVEEVRFCSQNKGKRRLKVHLYYQGSTYLLTVEGFKKYLWDWHSYTTKHHFQILTDNITRFKPKPIVVERSNGPAYFDESDIVENHFGADGKKLSLRFYAPKGVTAPVIQFKGWTGGVPESYACTVTGFGLVISE